MMLEVGIQGLKAIGIYKLFGPSDTPRLTPVFQQTDRAYHLADLAGLCTAAARHFNGIEGGPVRLRNLAFIRCLLRGLMDAYGGEIRKAVELVDRADLERLEQAVARDSTIAGTGTLEVTLDPQQWARGEFTELTAAYHDREQLIGLVMIRALVTAIDRQIPLLTDLALSPALGDQQPG